MYSSVDRCLGCSHFLALMNRAGVNIPVQVFKCLFSILWRYLPRRISVSLAILCLFEELPNFCREFVAFYILQAMYKRFQFSHILVNIYFPFLKTAILMGTKWYHCSFDLHFPVTNSVEDLFMYLLAICISSSEKCLFKSFAHFVIGWFVFCQ